MLLPWPMADPWRKECMLHRAGAIAQVYKNLDVIKINQDPLGVWPCPHPVIGPPPLKRVAAADARCCRRRLSLPSLPPPLLMLSLLLLSLLLLPPLLLSLSLLLLPLRLALPVTPPCSCSDSLWCGAASQAPGRNLRPAGHPGGELWGGA